MSAAEYFPFKSTLTFPKPRTSACYSPFTKIYKHQGPAADRGAHQNPPTAASGEPCSPPALETVCQQRPRAENQEGGRDLGPGSGFGMAKGPEETLEHAEHRPASSRPSTAPGPTSSPNTGQGCAADRGPLCAPQPRASIWTMCLRTAQRRAALSDLTQDLRLLTLSG